MRLYKHQLEEHRRWQAVAVAAVAFLVPGLLLFVFVPAAVFAVIEGPFDFNSIQFHESRRFCKGIPVWMFFLLSYIKYWFPDSIHVLIRVP